MVIKSTAVKRRRRYISQEETDVKKERGGGGWVALGGGGGGGAGEKASLWSARSPALVHISQEKNAELISSSRKLKREECQTHETCAKGK